MQKNKTKIEIKKAQPQDLDSITGLLQSVNLPPDGLENCLGSCFIARANGEIVGSAALEVYGEHALLRSLAVKRTMQGNGISSKLIAAIYAEAGGRNIKAFYLLTETVPEYFEKLEFQRIARADFPMAVQASVQFTSACCASAVAMMKLL